MDPGRTKAGTFVRGALIFLQRGAPLVHGLPFLCSGLTNSCGRRPISCEILPNSRDSYGASCQINRFSLGTLLNSCDSYSASRQINRFSCETLLNSRDSNTSSRQINRFSCETLPNSRGEGLDRPSLLVK